MPVGAETETVVHFVAGPLAHVEVVLSSEIDLAMVGEERPAIVANPIEFVILRS